MIGEKGRKVKDMNAYRDSNTGAVINNNKKQYERRKREIAQFQSINKVASLEKQIAELKQIVGSLMNDGR